MNDKLELIEVINRYFAALDKRTFDSETFRKIFADNAVVVRPNGMSLEGPQAICSSHAKSMERFRVTQHLTSGFTIDVTDESNADFRMNLIAMHFWKKGLGDSGINKDDNYFLASGVISGSATRTSNGWRILKLSNNVIWRRGVGFQEIMNTK